MDKEESINDLILDIFEQGLDEGTYWLQMKDSKLELADLKMFLSNTYPYSKTYILLNRLIEDIELKSKYDDNK